MEIKKTIFALAMGAVAMPAMAQFQDADTDDRLRFSLEKITKSDAELDDSISAARSNITYFQMGIEQKDYKEAYNCWKWLMKYTPYAQRNLYAGNAPFMLYTLITQTQDKAQQVIYFNDLKDMFDKRLARLDTLNSFSPITNTKGDVLAVRADWLNWAAAAIGEEAKYDFMASYNSYSDAIREIKENGGREIEGSVLQNFIGVSDAYFKQVPEHRERYLQDYLDSKEACEKMLNLAKEAEAAGDTEKAMQLVQKYDQPLAWIEQTFAQSGAADKAQVIALYEKTIEAKKDDIAYLRSALTLMQSADCDDAEIYYKAAEYAYAIEPSFESAIALAQNASNKGDKDGMIKLYKEALELCKNDNTRGNICLRIASGLIKSAQYTGAQTYLEKARGFNPDLAGKTLLQQANINSKLGQYDQAIANAQEAKTADITVSGTADRLIANIQKVKAAMAANAAANAKAKAAYDAYMAKKKAEEDFWKGK